MSPLPGFISAAIEKGFYEREGLEAYSHYQIEREEQPLEPGEAFPMVQKLLRINQMLNRRDRVEVVLLSRNSADTGLRQVKAPEVVERHGVSFQNREAYMSNNR